MLNYDISEKKAKQKVSEIQRIRSCKANNKRKGKKLEDIYDNATEIKEKISQSIKKSWYNKSEKDKDLLKIKMSKSLTKFWGTDSKYVNSLKKQFSENRIKYNKTVQKEYLLALSNDAKIIIADKKRDTYYNHNEEERLEITKKRVLNSQKAIIKIHGVKKYY